MNFYCLQQKHVTEISYDILATQVNHHVAAKIFFSCPLFFVCYTLHYNHTSPSCSHVFGQVEELYDEHADAVGRQDCRARNDLRQAHLGQLGWLCWLHISQQQLFTVHQIEI